MNIKHIPYKKLMVRIKKKGKTRGRPSKAEIIMSRMVSHEMMKPSTKKALMKAQMDMFLYGVGAIEIKTGETK